MNSNKPLSIKVIDLFCGIGGLTHGFVKEGFNVVAGYDTDITCKYPYEANNSSYFINKDIREVTGTELNKLYGNCDLKILVGCAPCQPFSTYSYKNENKTKCGLLNEFGRLIAEVSPDIISMENVPRLETFSHEPVFNRFLELLTDKKYNYSYKIVDCVKYGIPQFRRRLVLLASKKSCIELIPETHKENNYKTVKDTIAKLPSLKAGETSKKDFIHRAGNLSDMNLKRIQHSKPGGTWRDWPKELQLTCHKKASGSSYVSVYGRMSWDRPAPTMTTHCIGLGNGRFGHPEQDRAISLREASLIQTFPLNYKFVKKKETLAVRNLARHIGNAVPVKLGQVIAKSIKKHITDVLIQETID